MRQAAGGRVQSQRQSGELELWELDRRGERQGRRQPACPARPAYRGGGNPRPAQSIKRRRARRRRAYFYRTLALFLITLCLTMVYLLTSEICQLYRDRIKKEDRQTVETIATMPQKEKVEPPEIIEDYLEVNDYSRPGTKTKDIKNIFVHYTANQGTSAAQNRSYFANLAETHERSASAHFIIGYEGEIIQCIPLEEQAYAVMTRNEDSLSIECCYLSEDGSFTQETYDTLVHTLAWLIDKYDLSVEDILRHYDCGGKRCPVYYVDHEKAWRELLADVERY